MGDYDGSGGTSHDDITSVVYAGVNLTPIGKVANLSGTPVSSARFIYLYAGYNLPTGSNTFLVQCTNNHFILVVVADYTGTNGLPPDNSITQDKIWDGVTAFLAATTTIATNADNCWLALALTPWDATGGNGSSTGATLRVQGSTYSIPRLYDSNGAETPPGNYSVTTTLPNNQEEIGHILMSFAPLATMPNPTSIICCVSP
jgi:hypothetical protein